MEQDINDKLRASISEELDESECKSWNPEQVSKWIYSLSEKFHYLSEEFLSHQVTGKDLLCLDDESLEEMITNTISFPSQTLFALNKFSRRIFVSRLDNLKSQVEEKEKEAKEKEAKMKAQRPPLHRSSLKPATRRKGGAASTWTAKSKKNMTSSLLDAANLDLDLSLGRIDNNEYDKQATRAVRFVTGTEVSVATAQRAEKLGSLAAYPIMESSDLSTADSEKRYNTPITFETQVPDWKQLPIIRSTKFTWDANLSTWHEERVRVKIAKKPFAKGSLRLSYYLLDLDKRSSNADSLVSLVKGHESGLKVAKTSIDPWEPSSTYFDDVHTQSISSKFAKEYNSYKFIPKKIAFLSSWVYRLDDRCTKERQVFVGVEDYLVGQYEKHLDNHGGVLGERNTPEAFAHFTYEASERKLMVCDIQGVGDLYTDPQIHSADGKGFGKGNLGIDGFVKFFTSHKCNAICQHFKFRRTYNPKLLIDGTAPAKRFMEQDTISTVATDTDRVALPLSVRRFEERRLAEERRALLQGTNEEDKSGGGFACWCCPIC